MQSAKPGTKSGQQVYLRPDVRIEPLVCRWHAWPHLIPPLQLALNLANRQIPALSSFIKNPKVHVAASRNPAMYGGPFVDLSAEKASDVATLLAETQSTAAPLLELAEAYREIDKQLQSTNGYSLNGLYETTPTPLAGLNEYSYDLHGHPRQRLIEYLTYQRFPTSHLHEIMLHRPSDGEREFFLNTPRLDAPDRLFLKLPFHDTAIDRLAMARTRSTDFETLCEALQVAGEEASRLREFFTEDAPVGSPAQAPTDGVRITYIGHASILLESDQTTILMDPILPYPSEDGEPRLSQELLPARIDYLVITHCHQDHFSPESLLQLRHRVGTVVIPRATGEPGDPSMRHILHALGYRKIIELDEFERLPTTDGEIHSLPFFGEHSDLAIRSKQTLHIKIGATRLLFLVDADFREPLLIEAISREIGPVDYLFLGMECHGAPLTWLYGPLLTGPISRSNDESRRLSASDSTAAARLLEIFPTAKLFVYAMGQEPWLKFMMGLEYTPESEQIVQIEKFKAVAHSCGRDVHVLNGLHHWDIPNETTDTRSAELIS